MQDTPSVPPDDQESSSPSTPSQSISPNRTIMLVLAYLGILALIPLLVETDDSEIQWHAKHGIVLMATWIVLSIALAIVSSIPVIGWVLGCGVGPFLLLFFTRLSHRGHR